MTAKELIAELQFVPQDTVVLFPWDEDYVEVKQVEYCKAQPPFVYLDWKER